MNTTLRIKYPILFWGASLICILLSIQKLEKQFSFQEFEPEFQQATIWGIDDPVPPQKTISLSGALNNPYFLQPNGSKNVYLYIDLEAIKDQSDKEKSPLNISLVMDRSGSMQGEGKLEYAKEAAKFVAQNLSRQDNFSFVIYDDQVEVISPSARVTQKESLMRKIEEIQSGGSTNLSGGMLEGYAQVKNTFERNYVNRVLLLSDGLANQGITDMAELQKIVSLKNSEEGISISSFGVGADFNEDLMTNLSEYGTGNYYFIDNADKIPEIFAKELKGLLSVVAQNASFSLNYPQEYFTLKNVYGYPYNEREEGKVVIDFKDVFSEEKKSVLFKFELKSSIPDQVHFMGELVYDDVYNHYSRTKESIDLELQPTVDKLIYESSINKLVEQNIILFESNAIMQEAIIKVDKHDYEKAKEVLDFNIKDMEERFNNIEPDSILLEQYNDAVKYRKKIEEIEKMDQQEIKMMQKSSKNMNYLRKRKKQ
ncbi:vWA domain-containing protein [Flexithrix dorotheae]|uniref:vWA domain-containing protein n=1 Tax=Flexithrix dorotheae TaxID=70993 RepID=UPI00037DE861|nr:VWA domain-containing protein [Flexithrix dorotheae]